MTIHKLTAGDGYTYLTRQVAGGDVPRERGQAAAEYYTAAGNPPGHWGGQGAPLLGVEGQEVSEEQMKALFGEGRHPNADQIIEDYLAAHVTPGMTAGRLKKVEEAALKAARLGRPFAVYAPLEPFDERVAARLERIEEETGRAPTSAEVGKVRREEARRRRAAVAGFDVVFAPVKSAALLWALDERAWVRDAVRAAHEEARDAALALLEEHAAWTRAGNAGEAQLGTDGLVYAMFDHRDSRAGDPNPHTHVAIANKVRSTDGVWRAWDARALYRMTVAASEMYNTAFETALTRRTGVVFEARADSAPGKEPVREVVGVPSGFCTHFSARRTEIEARYGQLIREYRRAHGRDPSGPACHRLARQATLETREGKKPARSLGEMRADWRESLSEEFGRDAVSMLMAAVPGRPTPQDADDPSATKVDGLSPVVVPLAETAARVVEAVAEQRSVWTVWNLRAEAERQLRQQVAFPSLAEQRRVVEAVVAEAASARWSICIEPPEPVEEPTELRRADGTSVFVEHAAARYTGQSVLDAEDRLVAAARTPTSVGLPSDQVRQLLVRFEETSGRPLDDGQRDLVTAFATDDRRIVAGIGPAGSGKTTAMRALTHVVTTAGRRLVPLATSANAAAVLGNELGVPAENVHKFLHEHLHGRHADQLQADGPVPDEVAGLALRPGDVVLVDEAGMAGTLNLDRLVRIAIDRGALVRLLGDDRQLGAVESGGALRLIATDVGAVELSTLYRFLDPAEAEATRKLRVGDATALDFYTERQRICGGSQEAMIEAAYTGWKRDMLAGKTTLMAAATSVGVGELAARARADRVEAGQVEADGVRLRDGNLAGVGDWITTRHNDRRLRCCRGKDWAKNGDGWQVTARSPDGGLTVRHLQHHGTLTLPPAYVAQYVELLYATTTHRAQGSTVDTAHPLISDDLARENLYVIASRAREATIFYVVTHELLPLDPDEQTDLPKNDPLAYAAREVLETVLAREGAEPSATQTIRDAQEQAASLATLVPRYTYAEQTAADRHYRRAIHALCDEPTATAIQNDPAWRALTHALRAAEHAGWQASQLLATVLGQGPLDDADSTAAVLTWRIEQHTKDGPAPARLDPPTTADVQGYAAALTAAAPGILDGVSVEAALQPPSTLTNPNRSGDQPPTEPGALDGYADVIADVLGEDAAETARQEPAWPALAGALAHASRAGHDPAKLLREVVGERELDTARQMCEVLTWRLNRRLAVDLRRPARRKPDSTRRTEQWRTLTWTLKGIETNGGDSHAALSAALLHARHQRTSEDPLAAVLRHARATVQAQAALPAETGLPPWIAPPRMRSLPEDRVNARDAVPPETADFQWNEYFARRADLITQRVAALAERVAADPPAWATSLGPAPEDPTARAAWLRHVGIVAAYRDQYQVTDDDPQHPLGPYVEAGRAGRDAHIAAAEAITAARAARGKVSAASVATSYSTALDVHDEHGQPQPTVRGPSVAPTKQGRSGARLPVPSRPPQPPRPSPRPNAGQQPLWPLPWGRLTGVRTVPPAPW